MKKLFNYRGYLQFPLKLSLKMKLTVLLTIAALFQIQANTYSQNKKISLDFSNTSVETIIHEIEALSEFKFLLNRKDVDLNRKVSIKVEKQKIENILSKLFSNTDVDFEILNKQIVLRRSIANVRPSPKLDVFEPSKESTQLQITGTIKDKDGAPLPGANIVEKGTTNGTQADFDGNFTLEVVSQSATLIVSYLGFASKEVLVNDQSHILVSLQESASGLEEVVVTALGFKESSDKTGSTSSKITSDRITGSGESGLLNAMGAKASGVYISKSSGSDPGGGSFIQIRGASTLTGSSRSFGGSSMGFSSG